MPIKSNPVKKLVIALVAFTFMTALFFPVVCHALAHSAVVELLHEHDAHHHAIPLADDIPVVRNQTKKISIQQWTDQDVVKTIVYLGAAFSPSEGLDYSVTVEPLWIPTQRFHLSSNLANAPPA